jgi:hypothetical protein
VVKETDYTHPFMWCYHKSEKVTNAVESTKKWEPCALVGMTSGTSVMENSAGAPQNIKI